MPAISSFEVMKIINDNPQLQLKYFYWHSYMILVALNHPKKASFVDEIDKGNPIELYLG